MILILFVPMLVGWLILGVYAIALRRIKVFFMYPVLVLVTPWIYLVTLMYSLYCWNVRSWGSREVAIPLNLDDKDGYFSPVRRGSTRSRLSRSNSNSKRSLKSNYATRTTLTTRAAAPHGVLPPRLSVSAAMAGAVAVMYGDKQESQHEPNSYESKASDANDSQRTSSGTMVNSVHGRTTIVYGTDIGTSSPTPRGDSIEFVKSILPQSGRLSLSYDAVPFSPSPTPSDDTLDSYGHVEDGQNHNSTSNHFSGPVPLPPNRATSLAWPQAYDRQVVSSASVGMAEPHLPSRLSSAPPARSSANSAQMPASRRNNSATRNSATPARSTSSPSTVLPAPSLPPHIKPPISRRVVNVGAIAPPTPPKDELDLGLSSPPSSRIPSRRK